METLQTLLSYFLHLDRHLQQAVATYHDAVYVILFLVVFCETGLVVTPFLPGDSLLFAAGALAAVGSLDFRWVYGVFFFAAIAGDNTNYWIGHYTGPKIFSGKHTRFLNREYLEKTHRFYEKYGVTAVVIGRFMPIIRTFVPYVAGVGAMPYRRFVFASLGGVILWVSVCAGAGYLWGNLPFVKQNFSLVVVAIILISVLPSLIQWLRMRRKTEADPVPADVTQANG